MVVFKTPGFLACHELLRRHMACAVPAANCPMLISSLICYSHATQWITSCFPYVFATMSILQVAWKFEEATKKVYSVGWGCRSECVLPDR
jgi:hypothetical protein